MSKCCNKVIAMQKPDPRLIASDSHQKQRTAFRSLKIGILGSRGIPNAYGGYEQFAQHLSQRLAARGHRVWVYNSSLHPYRESSWKGVRLIHQPDPEDRLGAFGQFVYDYHCLRDARRRRFDVLFQLGYTSSAIWFPIWPKQAVNVIHMDGLEWQRSKYRPAVRRFLKSMEALAARKGDLLIADSLAIRDHLRQAYGKEAVFIPYGAPLQLTFDPRRLTEYQLTPRRYFLAVARFVPENNLETLMEGYLAAEPREHLVLVGNTDAGYGQQLKKRFASERIRFLGGLYQEDKLNSLRHFARLYFHGHSVGGTNPSLLEAMACGAPIAAHDNPFNRAVLDQEAAYFSDAAEVARLLRELPEQEVLRQWCAKNLDKIRKQYNWEKVVDEFETLFQRITA